MDKDTNERDLSIHSSLSEQEMIVESVESEQCELNLQEQENKVEEQRPTKRGREEVAEEEQWILVKNKEKKYKTETGGESIEIYISSNELMPKQFTLAKLLKNEDILDIEKVKYINPYKIRIDTTNEISADKLENCKALIDKGWRIQRAMEVNLSYGVIRDVDIDMTEEEIFKSISCPEPGELMAVSRLTRRNSAAAEGVGWKPCESIRLCFKGSFRPPFITVDGLRIRVEPYVFPVSQCSRCWKLGHTTKRCPSTKIVCPKCSDNHPNCETTLFKCVNCDGQHMALLRSCPAYLKEKKLREIMSEFNCTYRRALTMYVPVRYPIRQDPQTEPIHKSNTPIITSIDPCPVTPSYASIVTQATIHKGNNKKPQPSKKQKQTKKMGPSSSEFEFPSYDDACINQNVTEDEEKKKEKVFGISVKKKQRDDKMRNLIKETEELKEQNLKLTFEISKLKKDMGKMQDDKFSDYLMLMRERDARYTLYYENLGLQMKLKELDGSAYTVDQAFGDPVVLRIALDRCREQLSTTQRELNKMTVEYADTVPRREFDALEAKHHDVIKTLDAVRAELRTLEEAHNKVFAKKKCIEEELFETKERCSELERAGTPRPQWELCGDFIGGGRDRWWQLASGLTSRDILRVLLKELGPAAESDHLEHFDGLGTDPVIPPYLRYEGKVRNLRLSRRDVCLIINDIWLGKAEHMDQPLQDYVTKYFEDRYQQASMRAEWAYNLCAGAEQMLDEPQVKLFWGALHGHLSERVYWGLARQWRGLRDHLYKHSRDKETISIEEFEKVCRATFPLKSEVDIKNLTDVVRKQLKMKINQSEVNLDKLFQENEEGFDRIELARELYRQRQLAQDKYIREVVAELGGKFAANKLVTVDAVKRAFAIVDPAIDHIRMERYIRWAFSNQTSPLEDMSALPLKSIAARLAAGDIERVGPRYRSSHRRTYK